MANDIVPTELPENIAKEFSVDAEGKIFVSKRGLARLCGVSQPAILKLLLTIEGDNQTGKNDLSKWLKPFEGKSFKGDNRIPDILASAVIKHYAKLGREQAEDTDMLLGALGLRTFGQKLLNYQPIEKRVLSPSEIVELCLLPVPSAWQRRFPEEYYEQLSRLTGLNSFGNSRPALWAAKTKELVYDYLPSGVYAAVKRCKAETDGYEKLHQFLSDDGLKILEQHQRQLLTLMQASATLKQLKTALDQSCSKTYQLILIENE